MITAELEPEELNQPDSGLTCLAAMLRVHGVATDAKFLRQNLGLSGGKVIAEDVIRCAWRQGLKARGLKNRNWMHLIVTPLPAIAARPCGGGFFIIVRLVDDKVLILDGHTQKPDLLTRDALESIWDGSLILITKRASLSDIGGQFNLGWFMGAVNKYRGLLGEVLIASFMLNVFGLVSPLFFQVVVDKVLVHRDISTLDVLIIGLVAVSIFESVLGGLRTYVFSHTTNHHQTHRKNSIYLKSTFFTGNYLGRQAKFLIPT
jgi:subfamily B ATP-binding cassette protein HlyB/CyaB